MLNNISTEDIGEKVTSYKHGLGIIEEVNLEEVYSVVVYFKERECYQKFTIDGRGHVKDYAPTLIFGWLFKEDFNIKVFKGEGEPDDYSMELFCKDKKSSRVGNFNLMLDKLINPILIFILLIVILTLKTS